MPTWNDAIDDYKRASAALERADRIAYMRHIRPFLEKIGYLLAKGMMPEALFRKIMNQEAYIILNDTVPLVRDKLGSRIPKGHELFNYIQAGYYFSHSVACTDSNSIESRIRKRLSSFGESLYLAYCTASEMAMHAQQLGTDIRIHQRHIDSLIRAFFDYLEKMRLAALPHYLLRILQVQPLNHRRQTPLAEWIAYWERMSQVISYSLSEDLSWDPLCPDPTLEQVEFFTERCMVLLGDSGTGKTVVALYKAYQWHLQGKQVAYITGSRNQITYLQCQTSTGYFPFQMYYVTRYLQVLHKDCDCVVIDNAQDIRMQTLQLIVSHTREQVLICSHASVASRWNRSQDILRYFRCKAYRLDHNWRLSSKQFKLARNLLRYIRGIGPMPFHYNSSSHIHFIEYSHTHEQRFLLLQLIQQHAQEKMALLFHTDHQVKAAAQFLIRQGVDVEYQYCSRYKRIRVKYDTLNFATCILKILRYDRASGLQFDTVILPTFDRDSHGGRRQSLYIALTRACMHCYILRSVSRRKF